MKRWFYGAWLLSGVMCGIAWAEPAIEMQPSAEGAQGAFTADQQPGVTVMLNMAEGQWSGRLRLEVYDLLTGRTTPFDRVIELSRKKGAITNRMWQPKAGVYRVRAWLEETRAETTRRVGPVKEVWLAWSGAKLAKDLPDDWPIGAHVRGDLPPLPGAKWYRYFAMWPEINREPDVYDWREFDEVFKQVRDVGGRLLIASDGSPVWTSARGKVGMAWVKEATAYPPDDVAVVGEYLRRMIARYEDAAGTLGALELCNEANTVERWQGTPEQMVAIAKVFKREAAKAKHRLPVVGLALSAGDHRTWVESMVKAGLLQHVDVVSAHFYEELQSYELATPINNLPKHVACVREPMAAAASGGDLPIWDTESGIAFAPREGGRLVEQDELNRRAESDPRFDAKRPWLVGDRWRPVSERRAAAEYVSGTVMLMAMGVQRVFCYSTEQFMQDGAPSLLWVAMGQLGHYLDGVDYHHIEALPASVAGSGGGDGQLKALAYLIGAPGGKRVIVAWAYISDTSVGRSKHWQQWVDPAAVRITTDVRSGVVRDLYGRSSAAVEGKDGVMEIECGEEPVFIVVD